MTARDAIHEAVRRALAKDGWVVTADPLAIVWGGVRIYADLAAERAGQTIAVEVKSFVGPSPVHDLEVALGQSHFYRFLISKVAPAVRLHLAVPKTTYETLFDREAVMAYVEDARIPLVVVDVPAEEVVKWTA